MECINTNNKLKEILIAHKVDFVEKEGWLVPYGKLPAINMHWYPKPKQHSGVLQVEIFIDENTLLIECFGGLGDGDEAIDNGVQNFCINSLHVMLAAFWGINDPEQVETEKWTINDKDYTVYIGPFGTKGVNGIHPGIPENLFDTIETAVKQTKFIKKFNWIRTYAGIFEDNTVLEALHNNEDWIEGSYALEKVDWLKSDGFYSIRNFLIAIQDS